MSVLGIGEALLRLSAPAHQRLEHAAHLEAHVGGAELNALTVISAYGLPAAWVSRLADNPLGRRIAAHAAAHGVEAIVDWDADARAPLYFVEHGAQLRPSEVLYDRDGTAMRDLATRTFDWAELVSGRSAVLASGITCALGPGPADAVEALLGEARAAGARTAFDVNHRARLWSWEEAVPVLRGVLEHVDVLAAGAHDLERILGGSGEPLELARRSIDAFGHELVLLRETVTAPREVRVTVTAVTGDGEVVSPSYEAEVIDSFGAGDAALGAFLAVLLGGEGLEAAVDQSAWACAFHQTTPGDAWLGRPSDLRQRDQVARRVLR